jgi:hypothetical protein
VREEALPGKLFVNARHELPATWRLAVSDNGKKRRSDTTRSTAPLMLLDGRVTDSSSEPTA